MGRWDPRRMGRADDDPVRIAEHIDDVDDPAETLAHAQQHVARLEAQLRDHPPTDPHLVERLQRELAHWRRTAAAVTLDDHWVSGDGDRTLF